MQAEAPLRCVERRYSPSRVAPMRGVMGGYLQSARICALVPDYDAITNCKNPVIADSSALQTEPVMGSLHPAAGGCGIVNVRIPDGGRS
jgi:hypothetical protein